MIGNYVFDIDGVIAIMADYELEKLEDRIRRRFGEAFLKRHRILAVEYPHHIFPGFYALVQWIHRHGGKIYFFSSGIEKRNVDLIDKLMHLAFGAAVEQVPYRIFSRQHCIDTSEMKEGEGDKYQGFFWGQRKKKLGGIVVPEDEVPNTLIFDDDISYIVKGEQRNFVSLNYTYQYLGYREEASWSDFIQFHKAFYIAGFIERVNAYCAEHGATLSEAAKIIQLGSLDVPFSKDSVEYLSVAQLEFYERGLELLREVEPDIKFYYEVPEDKSDRWR